MATNQGTDTKVEEVKEPTEPKEEPTGYKTEEEYNKALQTAVSKGLESIQQQLDKRLTETDNAKAETATERAKREGLSAQLQDLQSELVAITGAIEDNDLKSGVLSKTALGEERRKNLGLKAEVEGQLLDAKAKVWRMSMEAKAGELVKETGININDFIGCETLADMEVKALRYSIANPKPVETKEDPEEKREPSKFTTAGRENTNVGSGLPTTKAGLTEWVNTHSMSEYEERAPEINKLMREGKIK